VTARRTREKPTAAPPPSEVMPWHQGQWQRLLAQQQAGRVPHALLLRGPTGVGKARFGRYLANSRLCMAPGEQGRPCGQCRACVQFTSGSHPDFQVAEPEDGKRVIAVDRIRAVIDWLSKRPHYPGPKLLLFPAADRMNTASANALLKTLEEPAGDALILLVTARPAALPATIRSRCQSMRFTVPDESQSLTWLKQAPPAAGVAEKQLLQALHHAFGSPLSALEFLQEAEPQQVLAEAMMANISGKSSLPYAAKLAKFTKVQMLEAMLSWASDLTKLKACGVEANITNEQYRQKLVALASKVNQQRLFRFYDQLNFNVLHT